MAVIVLRLEQYKSEMENRPSQCPYCGGEVLQRWGAGSKPVQDAQAETSEYHRYRCNTCQRTFRHYAPGIDKSHLTQRIRKLAGMAWALGLSAREVVDVFAEAGVELNYMAVWREGNELVNRLQQSISAGLPGRYTIDKLFLRVRSRGVGTSILVELGEGKSLVLGRMDEVDYRKVLAWLKPILTELEIEVGVMGTDILFGMNLA